MSIKDYAECALWSSMDDNGEPLDSNYTISDISQETMDAMQKDVDDFLSKVSDDDFNLWEEHGFSIGHDFWLTRNHHGAGFWDRYIQGNTIEQMKVEEAGKRLTAIAHQFPEVDLYIGDDGKIYET